MRALRSRSSLPTFRSSRCRANALAYAQRLARDKARAVFARHPDNVVLGADTIVVAANICWRSRATMTMLPACCDCFPGRVHQVITGVCLMAPGFEQIEAEITEVRFSSLQTRRSLNMLRPASPWTRPERMRSRA